MDDVSQLHIDASHKKIADVFSKSYSFSIPAYQRPYAWEKTQVEELLADLDDAAEGSPGNFYFLGSVVLVKRRGVSDSRIVDGQQRLTTLTILFSVIRDLTEDQVKASQREQYIKQLADEDQGIPEILRLQLRPEDQPFFEKHIQLTGATNKLPATEALSDSRLRIIENASVIREHLLGKGEAGRLKLLQFLLQRCYLVVVEVPSDSAARRIFSVLNTRGLDLAATDILKANLLEGVGGQEKEIALSKRWESLENALGRDSFNALFTYIRMIYERDKPRAALEVAFPAVVEDFRLSPEKFIDTVLEPYADALVLANDNGKLASMFGSRTAGLVRSLQRLDNRDWLPVLLYCLRRSSESNQIDVPDIVFNLERLAYFLFITRADINARINRYADVLDSLDPQVPERTLNRPRSAGFQLKRSETNSLFDSLDGNVYLTSKVVKPLLLRLEQASTDGSVSFDYPVISVEHVCPQTVANGSEWAAWFPDSDEHANWVHRLPNLVLLSSRKNSSAQNYDFEKKKTKYFVAGDSSPFILTNEVRGYAQWTIKELEERRLELLQRLAKTWGLEADLTVWRSPVPDGK